MTSLTAKEKEYLELVQKFMHGVELTDEEYTHYLCLKRKLRIKNCKTCNGQGYLSFPSMLGYGYDEGTCKPCQGTGSTGQSPLLHEELISTYTYHPLV